MTASTRAAVAALALLPAAVSPPAARAQQPGPGAWVRPPALRPGDTVAFVAPAGPVDPEVVKKARERFEHLGFRVTGPDDPGRRDRYLAGSDDARAAELNAAIRDRRVRAVVAVRGGYGLTRILDRVDYPALRKDPKVVAGFSDLTALHLAVAKKCRLVTFHSPMPQHALWRTDGGFGYSSDVFWRAVRADRYPAGRDAGYTIPLPNDGPKPRCLVPGTARGRLVGGNLSLIAATVGTPYQVEAAGNILVVEDTGEKAYRIDRMLSQLRLAGLLDKFTAVVAGTFDGADEKELDAVLSDYFSKRGVPVVVNYPIGHTAYNATFPHGGLAEVDAGKLSVRLLEAPVVVK